jgi:aryl-alcohol dehydrogenase-like predicted oxidoreductase
MNYRKLGKTDLNISEIGFGTWQLAGAWGKNNENPVGCLKKAIDLGINFIDTAYVYSDGESERIIGETVKNIRDRVIIATKIPPTGWVNKGDGELAQQFNKRWIIEATERSLKKLDTDYIDLQQLHAWSDELAVKTEWFEALSKLKEQGKIRFFGASIGSWKPYDGILGIEKGLLDTIQVIYNIFEQRPEEKLFPAALKYNTGIIVRVPYDEGMLTGKIKPDHKWSDDDWRKDMFTESRIIEAWEHLDRLQEFLGNQIPTLANLALKFSISHPAVSTSIPGMRSISHVIDNTKVSRANPLSADVLQKLKAHQFIHGWKYPWSE